MVPHCARWLCLVLLLGAACVTVGCASGDPAPAEPQKPEAPPTASRDTSDIRPQAPRGPAIRVTWEALARERYLYENSRFRRPGSPMPDMRISLVSESHPDAERARAGRTEQERREHAHSAVVPDADLVAFVRGLQRTGFFRHARATGSQRALRTSENARGRVTVERGGMSMTLVSLRGQGLDPRTKEIPRIYSESKQAVMMMRNRTPTLNVSTFGAQPLR